MVMARVVVMIVGGWEEENPHDDVDEDLGRGEREAATWTFTLGLRRSARLVGSAVLLEGALASAMRPIGPCGAARKRRDFPRLRFLVGSKLPPIRRADGGAHGSIRLEGPVAAGGHQHGCRLPSSHLSLPIFRCHISSVSSIVTFDRLCISSIVCKLLTMHTVLGPSLAKWERLKVTHDIFRFRSNAVVREHPAEVMCGGSRRSVGGVVVARRARTRTRERWPSRISRTSCQSRSAALARHGLERRFSRKL